jgi:cytochrome c553
MRRQMIGAVLACVVARAMSTAQADAPAVCHGEFGVSIFSNAPNLAGRLEIYLAKQLKAYRSGKRSDEIMIVIPRPLTDAEITDLTV